jgi:phage I-like protein
MNRLRSLALSLVSASPSLQVSESPRLRLNAKAPEHGFIFAPGQAIEINTDALPDVIQIAPFGRWPTRDKKAVQVFNAESAEQILSWFNFFPRRLARLARINSVKVWVGHPDFAPAEWPERIELGSITELMIDEHGLNARVEWNAEAMEHVTKHKFPSVAWDCDVNDDGTETPAMLWSVGMWHRPNIKSVQPVINADATYDDADNPERAEARTTNEETQPETNMLKNIMAALVAAGIVKENDDENSILGAIGSMIQSLAWKREETQRQAAMASQMRTALNAVADVADVTDEAIPEVLSSQFSVLSSQLNAATTERDAHAATIAELNARVSTLSAARITEVINRAIETGRATKADEDTLRTQLNAAPDTAIEELLARPVQLNCKALAIGGNKPAVMQASERTARLNAWLDEYQTKAGCNYDAAWEASKADPQMKAIHEAMKEADAARN